MADGDLAKTSRSPSGREPNNVVYFYVDDVDAIAAEFGATIETQPRAREIELTHRHGNRLRIGTRSST